MEAGPGWAQLWPGPYLQRQGMYKRDERALSAPLALLERGSACLASMTDVQETGAGVASGEQAGSFQTKVLQEDEKQS